MEIVKKTFHHFKENGVLLTFMKTWDYVSFKIKSKKIKGLKTISVNANDIRVTANPTQIHINFKDISLTNNVGLSSRLKNLDKYHDSIQSKFSFQKLNNNKILVKQYWWNLPLTQLWEISLKSNTMIWEVFLNLENSISIEEFQSGIILNHTCINNQISVKNREFSLPKTTNIKNIVKFPLNEKEVSFKIRDNSSEIGKLKFSIIDSINVSQIIIQNTTRFSNGYFVQAALLNEKIYNAGCHKIFKIVLEFNV
ncbi:MAG: hypothetical protein P9M06_00235 [Candidatus Saelkia tenebricola]|nr:hypothetical protein [Candidatus Saelkia tenebricola]